LLYIGTGICYRYSLLHFAVHSEGKDEGNVTLTVVGCEKLLELKLYDGSKLVLGRGIFDREGVD